MKRRDFIALLGGVAAWPLAARAQQPALPVIGFLTSGSFDLDASYMRAFRQGLSETGYIEGRNVAIDYRTDGGQYDRLPALAADLVRRQVNVIVAGSIRMALAAKAATTTIPIVFASAGDPIAIGLVASLNRPGGNLTGVTTLNVEVGPKRLELLHEVVPTATLIGLLVNPTNPLTEAFLSGQQAAARSLGLAVHVLHASTDRDIDAAFATNPLRAPVPNFSSAACALVYPAAAAFAYQLFANSTSTAPPIPRSSAVAKQCMPSGLPAIADFS
jgi:putative ABC transport system substrate-binding protein